MGFLRNNPRRPRGHIPGGFRQLSSTQTVPDAALSAVAKAVDRLGSIQQVSDAVLVAQASTTSAAVRHLTANQQVPDAVLSALFQSVTGGGNLNTSFALTSSLTNAAAPFSVGHSFKQGDVPNGSGIVVLGANAQVAVKSVWPDGSTRFTIISGTANLNAGVPWNLLLSSGAGSSGIALTTADLKATGITASIACGALGTVSWSTTDWDSPAVSWVSGHRMSSWIYRKPVGSDPHLVACLEVRLFAGGAVAVLPYLENGYLLVAAPGRKTAEFVFTLGGTERYRQWIGADYSVISSTASTFFTLGGSGSWTPSFRVMVGALFGTATFAFSDTNGNHYTVVWDTATPTLPLTTIRFLGIAHHTRIPLVSGTSFSHWLGTDPLVDAALNTSYLRGTKLVPNISGGIPGAGVLDGTVQSYTSYTLAGDDNATGATGGRGCVIDRSAALYLNSNADVRAYRAAIVHGFSSGSWSFHLRDSTTQLPPLWSTYPTIRDPQVTDGSDVPQIPWSNMGGEYHNDGPKVTHEPSYGFFPYLLTGWYWFLEESQFWSFWNYCTASSSSRENATGIIDPASGYATRGAAWALNVLGQTAIITPQSHPLYNQHVASLQANATYWRAKYFDGVKVGQTGWVSPMGHMGDYNAGTATSIYPPDHATAAWWGSVWMNNYFSLVWGYLWNIGLVHTTQSKVDHLTTRNHAYRQQIGRSGSGNNGNFNYRRITQFGGPIGTPNNGGLPPTSWYTHRQNYADYLTGYALSAIPGTPGLSLKQKESDADLGPAQTTLTYLSPADAALAEAVEHNVPGANRAFALVRGASNYGSSTSSYYNDEAPEWGMAPRPQPSLPYALPQGAATALKVDLNSFFDVKPFPGSTSDGFWSFTIFDSFGGGCISDEGWHAACTGGHDHPSFFGDVTWNGLTGLWSRFDSANPGAPIYTDAAVTTSSQTNGAPFYEMNGSQFVPASAHLYGQRNWIPPGWLGVGALGGVLVLGRAGVDISGQQGSPMAHKFDIATRTWSRASTATTFRSDSQANTILDYPRRRYWVFTKTAQSDATIQYLDAFDASLKTLTVPAAPSAAAGGATMLFDGVFVRWSAGLLWVVDPDNPGAGWQQPTVTGPVPSDQTCVWCEMNGKLYYREPLVTTGVMWKLTPPANGLYGSGTWTCAQITLNISLPPQENSASNSMSPGLFYLSLHDRLLWVTKSGVYSIKPE